MSTTEAENKALVRRVFDGVWNEGNLDLIDENFAEDYVLHSNQTPEPVHGPDGFKELVSRTLTAFPDMEATVEDRFAEGDKVVTRARYTATHNGEFMGIEPTGTEVENTGITITRIEDGKIVESWSQTNVVGLMQQLGVLELPGE